MSSLTVRSTLVTRTNSIRGVSIETDLQFFDENRTALLTVAGSTGIITVKEDEIPLTDNHAVTKNYVDAYRIKEKVAAGCVTFMTPYESSVVQQQLYAWVLSGNLNTARSHMGSAGRQNAALCVGGLNGSDVAIATVEVFNGSSWSTAGVNPLAVARYSPAGVGIANASIFFGGVTTGYTASSEKYNGTTWVSGVSLNTARAVLTGAGVQNSTLAIGGRITADPVYLDTVEEHNGHNWTAKTGLSVARSAAASAGSINNTVCCTGNNNNSYNLISEKYNGSTWASVSAPLKNRFEAGGVGRGNNMLLIQGSAFATERFNGADWHVVSYATYSSRSCGAAGDASAAVFFGGIDQWDSAFAWTSVYTGPSYQTIKVDTYGLQSLESWAVLNSLPGFNRELSSAGTANSAIAVGGYTGAGESDQTHLFNGNTWSTLSGATIYAAVRNLVCFGTQNSCLAATGRGASTPYYADSMRFNGITWTVTGDVNTVCRSTAGTGTLAAGLLAGGEASGLVGRNTTELFNGSGWSVGASLNAARTISGCVGKQTATLIFGGLYSSVALNSTEKYNGNSWTTVSGGTLLVARAGNAASGVQNRALCIGGTDTTNVFATTEKFNGSTWYVASTMNVPRYSTGASGTQNSATCFGGVTTGGTSTATAEQYRGNVKVKSNAFIMDAVTIAEVHEAEVEVAPGTQVAVEHDICGFVDDSEYLDLVAIGRHEPDNYWTVADSLNEARCDVGGCGAQSATIRFGGYSENLETYSSASEKYDGTVWSTAGNLNAQNSAMGSAGTQNAALCVAGFTETSGYLRSVQKYNGYTWSYTNDTATVKSMVGCTGVQNNALLFGGYNSTVSYNTTTSRFDGYLWYAADALNTGRYAAGASGTVSSSLCFGGQITGSITSGTEVFKNNVWEQLSGGNLNISTSSAGSSGTSISALAIGGNTGASPWIISRTEKCNGSVWAVANDINTATAKMGSSGSQNAALIFGGVTAVSTEIDVVEKRVTSFSINAFTCGIIINARDLIII